MSHLKSDGPSRFDKETKLTLELQIERENHAKTLQKLENLRQTVNQDLARIQEQLTQAYADRDQANNELHAMTVKL